ncbi:Aste57867_16003 [Aphanomyces stellatus]|uniref:Probable methyltransferase BMT2 homolog n=1 Tax=Aphanomyces stellatus TaxID=120398 RepID=A0A485L4F7_9STRA|nr:hypothetical protein As57867_015947 [Aphanomyces stellatus]VFT92788.1 Aste57867_16003 [Aphanomyces stellatus]
MPSAGKKAKIRKVPIGPPPVKSRRRARELTTEFHRVTHELQRLKASKKAKDDETPQRIQELEQRLKEMGGREAYQDASILSTSLHKTSRWVFQLLTKFELRPGKKMPPLDVLEVGAINTQLVVCPWLNVLAIDLISRNPKIQQIDFFDLDLSKRFTVVVSSMVINCVPTPEKRGEMLERTWTHLTDGGHFFLMLPLLCLTNSNFMTTEHFESILHHVGFSIREKKETPKIAFYCLQKQTKPAAAATFTQKTIRPGPKRNDFSVVLV